MVSCAMQLQGLEIESQGWKEIIKVRLLHASVRSRQKKKSTLDGNPPINQADMVNPLNKHIFHFIM